GGTCVNTGCMPTKALVASAYAAHLARRATDFGVAISGDVRVDMKKVKARKDEVVRTATTNVEKWVREMKGCEAIHGHARFLSPHEIEVDGRRITGAQIFLDVGGRALIPDMPGLDTLDVLTNTSIMELEEVPEHLVVIGGSYIGLEFAQMYRRFGAKVTVVEKAPRLIAREDEEISACVKEFFEKEGIDVFLGASASFEKQGEKALVRIESAGDKKEIVASHVLAAVGREPNTGDLGLEKAGVKIDARGYIVVDDFLRTNVPHIYALGDCNGRGAFTHTAYNDFEIVAANLLDGETRKVSERVVGYALYTDPPLGRVGMTETEARKARKNVKVGKRPMTRVGRAVEKSETTGLMKIVVDEDTKEILGAAILGPGGDEAIHGVLDMMHAKVPYPTYRWAVPIHPTVSELIPTLLVELAP
ncbi:MAG: FAD-containing oxidoreductase, partial [Polyangiaceae bacterium]